MSSSKSSKKNRPPKGVAQLPGWWLEITPHDTLDIEADAEKRKHEQHKAVMYANLAAKDDWEQKYGHPKYTLGDEGELVYKTTGKPVDVSEGSGFTKNENGEWLKDGQPIFIRQFKPGDYDPSQFSPTRVGKEQIELKSPSAEYGHKDMNWKKPDWMKVKLKETKKHAWLGDPNGSGNVEASPEEEEITQ